MTTLAFESSLPPPFLHSRIQYLANANEDGTATYYASEAGVSEAQDHEGQFEYKECPIYDGRNKDWELNINGFRLIERKCREDLDCYKDDDIKSMFYPEVEQILLQHVPGAKRVTIFDHTRRAATAALRTQKQCREPSAVIHNDYTAKSAWKRLEDLAPSEAEKTKNKRFAIVNVWKSIVPKTTVDTFPMAFCDSTTIDKSKDLISVKRVAKDRIGELQMALHNPKHTWYLFPNMTYDEWLVFKTFDTDDSCNPFTLHTALGDVGNADANPRQSIEFRAFVFFD